LQDLKILQVCVFGIDVKLDSGHRDIEVNAVEDLAKCRTASTCQQAGQGVIDERSGARGELNLPSSTLFDLGYV
jgi:hypothetical protein